MVLAILYRRKVPYWRNVTEPEWAAHSKTKYSHGLHLFPRAMHFLYTDGMSGTKEKELNFPAELVEIKKIPFKTRGCFLLTPYATYWYHILENKSQMSSLPNLKTQLELQGYFKISFSSALKLAIAIRFLCCAYTVCYLAYPQMG